MDSIIRILRRFVSTTIIISIFLIIINLFLLGTYFFKEINNNNSPQTTVKNVANNLQKMNNVYSLDTQTVQLLNQSNSWAMLINNTGKISWSYNLPNEIPPSYSLTDIAQLSRNYLEDYPVFVWEHDDGLIVIGYPKNSLSKYQFNFPIKWVSQLPYKLLALLIINIIFALLLSILASSKLIKSLRPLISGIHALSDDKSVDIEPKGILGDVAISINNTSKLLQKKNNLLKSKDTARSNWIAGISHDIRTPLSMVLGYSSELEDNRNLDNKSRKQASIIRKQAEKLRYLVNDLNLVSMLEYEMQPLNLQPIRLSVIARQIATDFLNGGLDHKYTIELDISNENLTIEGDVKLLTRAITNLLQNSIDHNKEGCTICIKTELDNKNNCHFIVSDNGKGVSNNELSYLTELPYSSNADKPNSNGHGLGLPMVSRIAKAHHGSLILTSSIGNGFQAELIFSSIQ